MSTETFGAKYKRVRKARNVASKDAAMRIGVSHVRLLSIEKGRGAPKEKELPAWLMAIGEIEVIHEYRMLCLRERPGAVGAIAKSIDTVDSHLLKWSLMNPGLTHSEASGAKDALTKLRRELEKQLVEASSKEQ